ncbi:MAG: hypothetical protein ACR2RV_13185 [Verrucomicrobiales bacterium]
MLNLFTEHPFADLWAMKVDEAADAVESAIVMAERTDLGKPMMYHGIIEAVVELEHLAMLSSMDANLGQVESEPDLESWQARLIAVDEREEKEREDALKRSKKRRKRSAKVQALPSDRDRVKKLISILKKNFAVIHGD